MEEKKTPIVLIILLLLIILGLSGYIVVDKMFLTKKEDTPTIITIDDVNIDLNALYQISDTLDKFDDAYNDPNSNYFGYLYKIDNRLLANKFDNGAALFAAMHDDMIGTSTAQYLIGGKVKENFEKIFGKNLVYKPANVNAGGDYNIVFNSSNGNFTYTAPSQKDVYSEEFVTKNIKTKLEEETVTITRRAFFVEYESEDGSTDITKAKIYTNSDKKKYVGTLNLRNNYLNSDEVLAKYGSRLDKYNFIFKQNNGTDDYCFYAIERVR